VFRHQIGGNLGTEGDEKMSMNEMATDHTGNYPSRLLLRNGTRNYLVETRDIVYCYSNNKVVYIVDSAQQKYMADGSLSSLEAGLDPGQFFKANRTHLVNFNYIKSFGSVEKNKMKVELKTVPREQQVIVSQTRVNAFRDWIHKQL
jgi:DNA-binding LytR/AlgR family response regulator